MLLKDGSTVEDRALNALQREAARIANLRGHQLTWNRWASGRSEGNCDCGAYVQAITRPMPNEINIGGPAVAINCTL